MNDKVQGCYAVGSRILIVVLLLIVAVMGVVGGLSVLRDAFIYSRWGKLALGIGLEFIVILIIVFIVFIAIDKLSKGGLLSKQKYVPFILTLVGVLGITGVAFWGTRSMRSELTPKFYREIAAVCSGKPIEGAKSYDPSQPLHGVAVVDSSGDCMDFCYGLPDERGITGLADLQLVMCVTEIKDTFVEKCEYNVTGDDGKPTQYALSLYRRTMSGRMVEATTGETVEEFALSDFEGGCPYSVEVSSGSTSGRRTRGMPDAEYIVDWLRRIGP